MTSEGPEGIGCPQWIDANLLASDEPMNQWTKEENISTVVGVRNIGPRDCSKYRLFVRTLQVMQVQEPRLYTVPFCAIVSVYNESNHVDFDFNDYKPSIIVLSQR